MVKLDPKEVCQLGINQEDVVSLEQATGDARLRFAAIDDVRRELDSRVGRQPGRRINWVQRVNRVRLRQTTRIPGQPVKSG